jgi:hypothetical protein
MCQQMVLDQALSSKSPLPKWDMNCKFMCKFDFSTQGCATLFARTTTLILLNQALKFFEFSLTPSPFLYVATPLPNLAIASL